MAVAELGSTSGQGASSGFSMCFRLHANVGLPAYGVGSAVSGFTAV